MSATSIVRKMANIEEQTETIIIKRCNMSDLENEITDEELEQIIKDMEDTDPEDMEILGDEELDDVELEDDEIDSAEEMDDTDEYL